MNLSSDISNFRYSNSPSNKILLSSKDDLTLWQEFKMGGKDSFSVIYHRYFNDLYNYGLKISADENLTKDCLQEMFTNLWFTKEKLGEVRSIRFYLLKSFRRSLVNYIQSNRKEQFFKSLFSHTQPNILFSSEEFIVAEETLQIRKEHLVRILNSLPKRRKEAIYLKFFKELDYSEIAAIMSLTEKAVINHVYKAFKSIKGNGLITGKLSSVLG